MAMLMLAADLVGFCMAVMPILLANKLFHLFAFQLTDFKYSTIVLICLLLYMNSKLYPGVSLNPAEEIRLVVRRTSIGFLIGLLFFSLIQSPWKINLLAFAAAWGISLFTILLSRWGTRNLAVQLGLWGEPVAVLARGKEAAELSCYFCQRRGLGFIPVIVTNDTIRRECTPCPIPVISPEKLLESHENRFLVNGIRTALVDNSYAATISRLDFGRDLFRLFQQIILISDSGWLEGASIGVHDLGGVIGIEARKNLMKTTDLVIKQVLDILLSFLLTILLSPLMIVVAVLIKLGSPGSVLYRQERVGKGGRKIMIYKFRTMVENADSILKGYLANDLAARKEWEQNQKLRRDPRITRIGMFLRRFSIDELPQLLNVLKGEMSLVGPRPIMVDQIRLYGDHLNVYCGVRPGLTGFWQVSGRNHTTFEERTRFDVYYVRNWSVWLDIYILLRTAWVVLAREGAY